MKKILLIEDNAEIRENTAEILELAGYKVTSAENGKVGIASAMLDKPDLIICDIMMPVLDGYGVLIVLQKNTDLQNIPFIFLTAKSEVKEVRKGMEMGADDYISKPFSSADLLTVIEIRLRKAEQLQKQFKDNMEGVRELIEIASGKDHLAELKEDRNTNHYKKKQLIYSEGNHPSQLFYITKGKAKSFKRNDDGKELIIGLFKIGDFLGYMPLIEHGVYKETMEALEETELAIIPRSDFDALLTSNPVVMKKIIGILSLNIQEKEEQLLAIAYDSLRKKVAGTLIILYNKYNATQTDNFFIDLSRENLAAMSGVATESLIRMLSQLKDEQLIMIEGSRIKVLNYLKLQHMYN